MSAQITLSSLAETVSGHLAWNKFDTYQVTRQLVHIVKIHSLVCMSENTQDDHSLQNEKLSMHLKESAYVRKNQAHLLARWVTLVEPQFDFYHTLKRLHQEPCEQEPEPEPIVLWRQLMDTQYNQLIYLYLRIQAREPLLKSLLHFLAETEHHNEQTLKIFSRRYQHIRALTLYDHKKHAQTTLRYKDYRVAKMCAQLLNNRYFKDTRYSAFLAHLHPYYPPPILRYSLSYLSAIKKRPIFVKDLLRTLFP